MLSWNGKNSIVNGVKAIAVVVGFIVIFGYARVEGADWRNFGVFGPYTYHYDSESISSESNGVKAWVRYFIISKESRDWVFQNRKKQGLSTKGYEDYTESFALWIINCSNNKWGVLKGNDYDSKGRPLGSMASSKSVHWLEIIPTSSTDVLRKIICR